jgi:hypothetical protein
VRRSIDARHTRRLSHHSRHHPELGGVYVCVGVDEVMTSHPLTGQQEIQRDQHHDHEEFWSQGWTDDHSLVVLLLALSIGWVLTSDWFQRLR